VSSLLPDADRVIGNKYRVLRVLGEGGMGAVFEAEHIHTLKRVAVKWLKATDQDARLRLLREAQAAARVRHPNVVDVYDVAQEGDAVFLVMEYLEGESLTDLLERGGMPVHELIALLLPAMRGVAAAHRQGVVHRDVKPDNIFLAHVVDAHAPVPKLLDFGISKLEPRGNEQLSLTSAGSLIGTPMYMSYEQLSGAKDVDARADVYAFGVVLYEALAGRPPFEADTLSELTIKIATTDAVPVEQLRPELPRRLADVIVRAMAKDRSARFPTMDALLAALEPFATEHGLRSQASCPDDVPAAAAAQRRAPSLPPRQPPSSDATPRASTRSHSGLWPAHPRLSRKQTAIATVALLIVVLWLVLTARERSPRASKGAPADSAQRAAPAAQDLGTHSARGSEPPAAAKAGEQTAHDRATAPSPFSLPPKPLVAPQLRSRAEGPRFLPAEEAPRPARKGRPKAEVSSDPAEAPAPARAAAPPEQSAVPVTPDTATTQDRRKFRATPAPLKTDDF